MDCLRSFAIDIDYSGTFNTSGTNVKTWGAITNYHWLVFQSGVSRFDIQGFKKIDIYGVRCDGAVQGQLTGTSQAIVQDWSFQIGINGLVPLISGSVDTSTDFWSIKTNTTQFQLGKYVNEVRFESPYSGVSSINFNNFRAQGNNAETASSIQLGLDLQFTFYYKYEGE